MTLIFSFSGNFLLAAETRADSTASRSTSFDMPFSLHIWSITVISSWFIEKILLKFDFEAGLLDLPIFYIDRLFPAI